MRISKKLLSLMTAAALTASISALSTSAYNKEFPEIPGYEDKELIVEIGTEEIPQPAPTPSDDPSPNTGSIVGGVSAGVIVLLAAFGIAGRKRTDKQ